LGINRSIDAAIDRKESPTLVAGGKAKRNYVYVHDLAEMISEAAEQRIAGVHIAAGREPMTMEDMVKSICMTFLSNADPIAMDGTASKDWLVVPSPDLPPGRLFVKALADIASLELAETSGVRR
jgi:nucleoside-diphosphate-sugar epimerase